MAEEHRQPSTLVCPCTTPDGELRKPNGCHWTTTSMMCTGSTVKNFQSAHMVDYDVKKKMV